MFCDEVRQCPWHHRFSVSSSTTSLNSPFHFVFVRLFKTFDIKQLTKYSFAYFCLEGKWFMEEDNRIKEIQEDKLNLIIVEETLQR